MSGSSGVRQASDEELLAQVEGGVVAFCRELVRTPSPSGDERAAAEATASEMRRLGYDEVRIDAAGNAIGTIRADCAESERLAGVVLLDAHLDHVDAGDPSTWTRPPFGAVVEAGRIFGRGASDTKSSVAGMVHAILPLRALDRARRTSGRPRRRDVVVAAVVQEEVGGLGTAALLDSGLAVKAAVIGEPSEGCIAFGNRGRIQLEVSFHGRSAHAARPDLGVNPHRSLARFVLAVEGIERTEDEIFGRSTVSPTLVHAEPGSPNVIPSRVTLTLDWRTVPGEDPTDVRARVGLAAEAACEEGVRADVAIPSRVLRSWTGYERSIERVSRGFAVDRASAFVEEARACIGEREPGQDAAPAIAWDFASDAGWLAAAGVPCLGYGPGDMKGMHVVDESVSTQRLVSSALDYARLAHHLAGLP